MYDWTSDFVGAEAAVQQRLVGGELSWLVVVAESAIEGSRGGNAALKRRCLLYVGIVREVAAALSVARMGDLRSDVLDPMLDWSSVDDLRRLRPHGALVASLCEVAMCAVGVYRPELADRLLVVNVEGDESSLPRETPPALLSTLTEGPWHVACQIAGVGLDAAMCRLSRARMAAIEGTRGPSRRADELRSIYAGVLEE